MTAARLAYGEGLGLTVMRLALTGVVVVGPVDFSNATAPTQPAVMSAPSAARMTPVLAAGRPGRAACAGRPPDLPVTV